MTDKEEAIERLKKDKNKPLACGDITIVNIDDLELVLNLLEKKDTLIHTMQSEFERLEDLEDNTDMLKMELEKKDIDIIEAKEANRQLSIELQKKDKIIDLIKEYAQQEIDFATEDIEDYIDDDREGNKDIIGELKEWREHWKDIIRIMNNEKTYIDFEYKVEEE